MIYYFCLACLILTRFVFVHPHKHTKKMTRGCPRKPFLGGKNLTGHVPEQEFLNWKSLPKPPHPTPKQSLTAHPLDAIFSKKCWMTVTGFILGVPDSPALSTEITNSHSCSGNDRIQRCAYWLTRWIWNRWSWLVILLFSRTHRVAMANCFILSN